MKITLVQCPSWTTESPPYALALLTALLKKHGHEVACLDLNLKTFLYCQTNSLATNSEINMTSWSMDYRGSVWYEEGIVNGFISNNSAYIEELVTLILRTSSKIIAFSVQSSSRIFSLEIARRIKARAQDKIIIFGGPLCFRNCAGISLLKEFNFIDFVCLGESENTLPKLLAEINTNTTIENLLGFGYRSVRGDIIDGGDAPLVEDLDMIPFADYSEFTLEQYTKKLLPLSTSRGCINRCTFCNESAHWLKYRTRSAQNIYNEIIHQLTVYPQIEIVWFNDSLMNGDIKELNNLCDLLLSSNKKILWGGQAMIRKEMNKDLLYKMKQAGCYIISYGVEHGNDKILKLMRKGYTAELAKKVIADTFQMGIYLIFNIIIGFPGETEIEFQENKAFIQSCKSISNQISLGLFLLLKDSYIYNQLDEFNINAIDFQDKDFQLKWKTKDNINTYDVRRKRLDELIEVIKEKTFFAFS